MDRRRFLKTSLKIGGYGLGAGLIGVTGGLIYAQPRRTVWRPKADDDAARPTKATTRKRVVVVGGGLAGLVAAIELAGRNFAVTLVERGEHLGGKLGGWKVKALGEEFPVEHGFHGFFAQYYNLFELLRRVGVYDKLPEAPDYPVLFPDAAPEMHTKTTALFPFNLLGVVRRSPRMKLNDFRKDGPAIYELMKYDPERTFREFDGVDFGTFAREGRINQPMIDSVLEPFGKTSLNRVGALSAAEGIRFFHFFMLGNPDGMTYKYPAQDSFSTVIEPLQRLLESLGGQVRTGIGARRLVRTAAGVTAVVVDAAPTPAPLMRVHKSELPATGFHAIPQEDGSAVFVGWGVGRRGAEVVAFDGRCTHMGCPVSLNPAGGFLCPCHGGTFDADGKPTGGPPKRPLRRLPVKAEGDRFAVGDAAPVSHEEALACDYCVVACEVRGVKRLFQSSQFLGEKALERGVRALGESDPYIVWRLWLDKPTHPSRSAFATCAQYRYTDSVAIYSRLQEPYIGWAKRTGGSVIELHAYAVHPRLVAPSATMRGVMFDELRRILPELASAKILHEEFQLQTNFSRFAPGDHATRPTTETPVPNLFLAGDHVKLPVPAALMEGATISGRFAANAVLSKEGLREVPVTTVALRGPLA